MDLTSISDAQLAQIAGNAPAPVDTAILDQENGGKLTNATSVDGAIGPSQIMPATFARFAKPGEDIHNPQDNLAVGQRYRDYLSQRFNGDPARIAVAYFSGEGNVAAPGSPTPWIKDTQDGNGKSVSSYVSDVLSKMNPVGEAKAETVDNSNKPDLSSISDEELSKIAGATNGTNGRGIPPNGQNVHTLPEGRNLGDAFVSGAASPFKPIVADALETLKNIATQTGQAISEPYNQQNVPDWLKPADAIVKTAGKAGNAVAGAIGAALSPITGALTASAEPFIPAEARAIASITGQNPNLTPEQVHALAQGQGANLTNAVMMGGASPSVPKTLPELPALFKDESSGSPAPSAQVLDFLKNKASGTPDTPPTPNPVTLQDAGRALGFIPKPPPAALMRTEEGQPLLVSPKAITQGEEDLGAFLSKDGIDLNKVADDLQAAQKINPNVRAIDIIAKDEGGIPQGSNTLGLANSIAQEPGQGNTMLSAMAGRGFTASDRIYRAFDKALAGSDFYKTKTDAIQKQEGTGDLYQKAFTANKNMMTPEISKILSTPAGQTALKNAATTMQNDRALVGVSDPDLVEQASLTGQEIPKGGIASGLKMRTLHYVKQELWDLAQHNRDPKTMKYTANGRAILQQYHDLLDEMNANDATNAKQLVITDDGMKRQAIPGTGLYAQANKIYATPARVQGALAAGRKFEKMDKEQIQEYMKNPNISDPEKKAFAQSVGYQIQDKYGLPEPGENNSTNPINRIWKPAIQKRIRPLFPNEQSFQDFAANMEHEKTMARINNKLQGNSSTMERANFKDVPKTPVGSTLRFIGNAMEPGNMLTKVGDIIDKNLQKQATKMSADSRTVAARYLTTKNPDLIRHLADRLGQTEALKKTGTK